MIFILLFIAVLFLAYTNGANDNFKGVATLFGSDTTSYRGAIGWATGTTLLGSFAAIFLANALVKNFSGKGLVPAELIQSPEFAVSIAIGAAATVFIATKIGMPISTTHSLVGGLFGAGVAAVGSQFNFSRLGSVFFVPLLVSPFMAAALSFILYLFFNRTRKAMGVTKEKCICVGEELKPIAEFNTAQADLTIIHPAFNIADEKDCVEIYSGDFVGVSAQKILDAVHYLSSGVVSFARGLNDTPKIVGLLLLVEAFNPSDGLVFAAVAIALGGLINARKVGETISKDITPMNHGQGFTANLITGLLVTTASIHGLPVSTTHVSVGSILGIGTATGKGNIKTIKKIVLSWILTLPTAAAISAGIYLLMKMF